MKVRPMFLLRVPDGDPMRTENALARELVDAAIHVHKRVGPGLLESAYVRCLEQELRNRGLLVEREVPLALSYDGLQVDCAYRVDLLVGRKVVVEVKSVESFGRVHHLQLLTYLRLAGCRLGFLLNFNVPLMREGIRRIIA